MSLKILVIYGSVRTNRLGIRAARYVVNECQNRGHEVTLVDPKETPLPLLDLMYKEFPRGAAPEPLEALARQIREADAFVVVTGEYNHSLPPALTNLMSHFLEEWYWRPSGIVCYSAGAYGGVRAAIQLRVFLGEIGTPSIPSIFGIPKVHEAFQEDGTPNDPERLAKSSGKFLDELEWYAKALANARQAGVPY